MDLTQQQWDKISMDSLDFILKESENYLTETFKSFREIVNRCYFTIGVYFAMFSYCSSKILDNPYYYSIANNIYILIMIGTLLGIMIIFTTLMPKHMVYAGTFADFLLIPHFFELKNEEQLREYKIQTILNSRNGCKTNTIKIDAVTCYFKASIITISIFMAVALIEYCWV